jgi:hypothetical protein
MAFLGSEVDCEGNVGISESYIAALTARVEKGRLRFQGACVDRPTAIAGCEALKLDKAPKRGRGPEA